MVTLEVLRQHPPGQRKKAKEQSFKGAQRAGDDDDVVDVDVVDGDDDEELFHNPR